MKDNNKKLGTATLSEREAPPKGSGMTLLRFGGLLRNSDSALDEKAFHTTLTRERRRAERSRNPFVLILVDSHSVHKNGNAALLIGQLTSAVCSATRETDIIGWYEEGETLGVIFTEINLQGTTPVAEILHSKVQSALRDCFDHRLASNLIITVHVFPESLDKNQEGRSANVKLYPDLSSKNSRKSPGMGLKRAIDIVGSCALLLFLSPLFAAIAIAIKLTSKGPVIFEQERLGQFGTNFKCLKFRTMYSNNDPKIHRDYVRRLIAGKPELPNDRRAETGIYKITNDPRITQIGKFLRKTSLDELPQFWNVLRGEMSLVGPRPPVPYEFEVYDLWHRRRILEIKPGVTGLWQVSGRSRTSFDDMVRLDLRYAKSWSLWLDLKILLATPLAALRGDGAF